MPTEEFNKFMRSETPAPEEIEGEGDLMREAYRYAKVLTVQRVSHLDVNSVFSSPRSSSCDLNLIV